MIKEHLQTITGVEIYAIAGFFIFFVFFILVTIHAMKMKKEEIEKYSHIPLEDEPINDN